MPRSRMARSAILGAVVGLALVASAALAGRAQGQTPASADCGAAIGPQQTLDGHAYGPTACTIAEARRIQNAAGAPYWRLEIGLDGTLAGYAALDGPRTEMFTDVPEMALAQRGSPGGWVPGIARYRADKGTGMTLFIPAAPADWNGALYVTAHGAGSYTPVGELVPREPDSFAPYTGANSYVGPMIDKGYAVAYTRRSAARGPSDDEQAVLDDGRPLGGLSFAYHTGLLRDFTTVARNLVQQHLGRAPERTYFYGHSAGAALGRLVNYLPGANTDGTGRSIFSGFLLDDAGGGYYLPQLFVDGQDVLFATPAERARFAPQIDVAHQAYTGEEGDYLTLKRENARLLAAKGLGDLNRLYEIVGVSHFDAGRVAAMNGPAAALADQNLDLGGVFDALVDALDAWVTGGQAPTPNRSDSYLLGGANGSGLERPAIRLPEIACPTGTYYVFPDGIEPQRLGTQVTAFAAYDGAGLEPLDNRGYLIDMNHNNTRDQRETVTQAWQRRAVEGEPSGTLLPDESLTPAAYAACVEQAAAELVTANLLSPAAFRHYVEQAAQPALPSS
ncbi:MAG TPA: alpha/beta hydrolase domain-containing protein [Chloroflexota bacterium]|nr:alpha/beta hydrolase domain-containing protein [Chloroflexota bacterium]